MEPYSVYSTALRGYAGRSIRTDEISSQESLMYAGHQLGSYNPDGLVGKKGLPIYTEMLNDEQVKACLMVKKYCRLSTGWEIKAGDENDKTSVMLKDYIETIFRRIRGTFYDVLLEILTALEYGYSISEIVPDYIEKGSFRGKLGLKKIATRAPFGYGFKTDDHGNLLGILFESVGMAGATAGSANNPFDPKKFVVYSYNKKFSNWFGESDLKAVYRSWFAKGYIIKFYNVFLERFGSPTAYATYPAGTRDPVKKDIDEILNNLQSRSGFRIPEGIKMQLLEAQRGGHAGYDKAIDLHNTMIARGILMPELLGFSGRLSGSQALGEVQFDVFIYILEKLGRDIEETIVEEQIIRRTVDWNWDNIDEKQYPLFRLNTLKPEDVESRSKILKNLADAGFVDPNEMWVRNYLLLPKYEEPKEGEGPKKPAPAPAPPILPAPGTEPEEPAQLPKGPPGKKPTAKKPGDEDVDKRSIPLETYVLRRQPDKFEKKVGFTAFARSLEATDELLRDALIPLFTMQRDKLLRDVERNDVIQDKDYRFVEKLQLSFVGKINATIQQHMVKTHLDSKLGILEEIQRVGVNVNIINKFQEPGGPVPFQPWTPVPPTAAVDAFNKKVLATIVDAEGVKRLITIGKGGKELAYYDSQAFAIAGIERDYVLKEAKMILQTGMKQGQATKEIMSNLRNVFDRYIPTGEIIDGKLLSPVRLETIVRTNISDAVNLGRATMMRDPLVKGFVPFEQWSAIIDDRTTLYCEDMDGRKFRIDDPLLDPPPAHFKCRSIMVPITTIEVKREGGIETSDVTDVPRAKGFVWDETGKE